MRSTRFCSLSERAINSRKGAGSSSQPGPSAAGSAASRRILCFSWRAALGAHVTFADRAMQQQPGGQLHQPGGETHRFRRIDDGGRAAGARGRWPGLARPGSRPFPPPEPCPRGTASGTCRTGHRRGRRRSAACRSDRRRFGCRLTQYSAIRNRSAFAIVQAFAVVRAVAATGRLNGTLPSPGFPPAAMPSLANGEEKRRPCTIGRLQDGGAPPSRTKKEPHERLIVAFTGRRQTEWARTTRVHRWTDTLIQLKVNGA